MLHALLLVISTHPCVPIPAWLFAVQLSPPSKEQQIMAPETPSFRNFVLAFLEQHEMELSNDQFDHFLELCHKCRSLRLETFVLFAQAISIPQDVAIQLHASLNAPESAISVEEDSSLSTNEESKVSEPSFHIEGINLHLHQNVHGDGPLTNPPQGHAALGTSGNSASASNPQQQEALELFEETSRTSQLAGEEFASNESSLLQYSHTTSKSSGGNPQM
jgi:hypothetical protein